MSDQSIGITKVPTDTTGRFRTGDLKAGLPDADGKAESSSGNALPLQSAPEEIDSEAIALTLNKMAQNVGRDLKFIVNLDSAQPIIQVFNSETGELIRQIPSASAATYLLKDGAEVLQLLDALA